MSDLRNHDGECEHGSKESHAFSLDARINDGDGWCPGGRKVTIDRLAAILQLPEVVDAEGRYVKTWGEIVDLVIDAAIGVD